MLNAHELLANFRSVVSTSAKVVRRL